MRTPKISNRLIWLAFACALLLVAEHRAPAQSTRKPKVAGPQPVTATQSGAWNVDIAATTVNAFAETRQVNVTKGATESFGPIDVSPYRSVRIAAQSSHDFDGTVNSLSGFDSFPIETMNPVSLGTNKGFGQTDVLDTPGTSIIVEVQVPATPNPPTATIKVSVWGRPN